MLKKTAKGFSAFLGEKEIISDAVVSVNIKTAFEQGDMEEIFPEISEFDEGKISYAYKKMLNMSISFKEKGNFGYFEINAQIKPDVIFGQNTFDPKNGIKITFNKLGDGEKFQFVSPSSSWWLKPDFSDDVNNIKEKTIALSVKGKKECSYYFTLTTDCTKTEFCRNSIVLTPGFLCADKISGTFLAAARDESPLKAAEILFENAFKENIIPVPSVEEREYPEMFKYFGWCSWNAFYHDVTSKGLNEKLEEFKEKNIPMKWILIDDGWSRYEDDKLTSFKEDKKKFPEGLDGFIKNAKEKFGVEYIGVWHAFLGYWLGIKEGSEVYNSQYKNLKKFNSGIIMPDCTDAGKAFDFWNSWHGYLKSKGVDFLKVDVQGSLKNYASGDMPPVIAAKNMAQGLDASVLLNFDGNLINCMGVTQENILSRPKTGLTRNSDDFFPDKEGSFANHLKQNAYVSVFHNKLYHCDWDMWWTDQGVDSVKSGVLRAVSGGPVYISDRVGTTVPEAILPIIEDDGLILRCDKSALPSEDCMFTDIEKTNLLMKVTNTVGENGVIALFNISENKKKSSAKVKPSDVYGLEKDRDYVAYSYFEKKFYYLTKDDELEFSLDFDSVEIINFYPVKNDRIYLGDTSKYISSASSVKKEIRVDELDF